MCDVACTRFTDTAVSAGKMKGTRMPEAAIIPGIIRQHCEECASSWSMRQRAASRPDMSLTDIADVDERLDANLDGLRIAGSAGWSMCRLALGEGTAGALFAASVLALDSAVASRFANAAAVAQANPSMWSGLETAFGWVGPKQLQGVVASILSAPEPSMRAAAISACAMHRVDPGLLSARRIDDSEPTVRARALRTAGEIGCDAALSVCSAALADPDLNCRFWGTWSSVLLGAKGATLDALVETGMTDGRHRARAFRLALQAMNLRAAHQVLQELASDPAQTRRLIQGSGIAGDSKYVPWLIKHLADAKTARLAGEAFSLITGVDLSQNGLEGKPPEEFESGPNDDPDDPNVDMDPDDGLQWPDAEKIEKWWLVNGSRFQKGIRYFMGAPVTRQHCLDVLKNGYQRQRILAAHYLCLLEPGTPFFNTSAPAWRQQRLLAKMT
jgi:uncharacterized protein (TIGR02270 family)